MCVCVLESYYSVVAICVYMIRTPIYAVLYSFAHLMSLPNGKKGSTRKCLFVSASQL